MCDIRAVGNNRAKMHGQCTGRKGMRGERNTAAAEEITTLWVIMPTHKNDREGRGRGGHTCTLRAMLLIVAIKFRATLGRLVN